MGKRTISRSGEKPNGGPLCLHRLEIQNMLSIDARTIPLEGNHALISGRNGSGKSSTVDLMWWALEPLGKRIEQPVKLGESEGHVTLDLGKWLVTRAANSAGHALTVRGADGTPVKRPAEIIEGLLSDFALNPREFLAKRPQDQVDEILRLCKVAPPVDEVEKITGERIETKPGESADGFLLRLSEDHTGVFFVRRLEAGRRAQEKRNACDEQNAQLTALGGPVGEDENKSASDLMGEIDGLNEKAEARRRAMEKAATAETGAQGGEGKLAGLRSEKAEAERRIEGLQRQIDEERQKVAVLVERIGNGEKVVAEAKRAAEEARAAATAMEDVGPALERARNLLKDVEKHNEGLVKRKHVQEQVERLEIQRAEAEADRDRAEEVLNALRNLRRHLLDGRDIGVEGLAVVDGRLELRGVGLGQASTAEQYDVACAVAVKQRPQLRLLRIDDGEHLDSETRKRVFERAERHGFQVLMTAVADGDLKVDIVERVSRMSDIERSDDAGDAAAGNTAASRRDGFTVEPGEHGRTGTGTEELPLGIGAGKGDGNGKGNVGASLNF